MKGLLGNLLGVVGGLFFAVAAAYAISGGPQFPAGANIVGTYAGVLTPTSSPCPSVTPAPVPDCTPSVASCGANSLGVFSVGAPQSGIASGTFVMFAQGRVFSGTIQGVADPQKATLKGILTARYDFTVTSDATPCPCDVAPTPCVSPVPSCTPSKSSEHITALANGSLKSRITTTSSTFTGIGATRLKGTATLDISNGTVDVPGFGQHTDCEIYMKVSGFKQSNTAGVASIPSASP